MKAIIVGGGIGGLVTALMLHARGIDCEIYEQADAIRELGVGINTLPHAIKELKELGLLERLDAVAIRTYELFYLNRFGQEIWRELRGTDAGFEVPQFSIHRGKLQHVIYVARRHRLAAVPHRPLNDDRGRAGGEVRALPYRCRQRARPPPHQLGRSGARLRWRNTAAAQGGLVTTRPLG